ncbi:MAG: GntR family transcriptional regulator [Chloroflexi bacterium]|nr:GntR family transcriptional regulator [Chloroflexota bacterium]
MAQTLTKSEIVFNALQQAIVRGHLKPRERLVEVELAQRFKVSRVLIREVIKKMESTGLVSILPHKGAQVTDLSPAEIEDIHFVLAMLEAMAARLASGRITSDMLAELESLVSEMDDCPPDAYRRIMELNDRFHDLIYQASASPLLCQLIKDLHLRAHVVCYLGWGRQDRLGQSCQEHREIIHSLRSHNLPRLEELIKRQRLSAKEHYLQQIDLDGSLVYR